MLCSWSVVGLTNALSPSRCGLLLEPDAVVRVAADEAEVVLPEPEDRAVVDHPAGLVAQRGVADLADGEAADVAGQRRLHEQLGVRAEDLPLAQRREVHGDGALAARVVLGLRALVVEAVRQPVAAVLDEALRERGRARVEAGLLRELRLGVGGHAACDGHGEPVLRCVDADVDIGALPGVGGVDVVRAGGRGADEIVHRPQQDVVARPRPRLVGEEDQVGVEARVVEEVQRRPALALGDRVRRQDPVEVLGAVDVPEVAGVLVVLRRAGEAERVVAPDGVADDLHERVHVLVVELPVQPGHGVRVAHERARRRGVEAALDARAGACRG